MCSNPHQHDDNWDSSGKVDGDEEMDSEQGQQDRNEDVEGYLAPSVDSPPPDEIANLCGRCIDYVARAIGVELDFTEETLPILDHYVSLARGTIGQRPEIAPVVSGAIGAYFGELLRRRFNGYWLIPNPDVHNWLVCARNVFLSLNPVGVACEALAQNDEHSGPSGELRLAPEDKAIVAERLLRVPPVPVRPILSAVRHGLRQSTSLLRRCASRWNTAVTRASNLNLEDYETI